MARLGYYINEGRLNRDGKCHVKIVISHRGTNAQYATNVFVKPEHWHPGNQETDPHVKKTCVGYRNMNAVLSFLYERINDELLLIVKYGMLMSFPNATVLRQHLWDKINGTGPLTFTQYFRQFSDGKTNRSTKESYQTTYNKIMAFAGSREVSFEDLTINWLTKFEKSMSSLSVNARAVYLRNIRTVVNSAINNEITSISYPFRKFKIKHQKTSKRALSTEDLKKLRDHECESHQRLYRDIFMLIFYLRGINIIDLCHLTEIHEGRIEFYRAKTARKYSIKVEPEAMEIIERYRGKKYLLDILDRYNNYKNFRARMNDNLKEIGTTTIVKRSNGRPGKKEKTGMFPKLTTYWARHSVASIAWRIGIPKDTIAQMLGHGSETVTDIYIDYDNSKVDEAMRKVIDALK